MKMYACSLIYTGRPQSRVRRPQSGVDPSANQLIVKLIS